MATVELRPGDTLNIVWSSVQDTPLGVKKVESSFAFSYDELLSRLRTKGRIGKSRRSGTAGARFSRVVALSVNALRKGKWSTGADIDRNEVFDKMLNRFNELDPSEYQNITAAALQSLASLQKCEGLLETMQRKALHAVVNTLAKFTA